MSSLKWILVEVGINAKSFHVISSQDILRCESEDAGSKVEFSRNGLTLVGDIFCSSPDKEFVMQAKANLDSLLGIADERVYCLLQYSKSPMHMVHRLTKMRIDSPDQKQTEIRDEDGLQYNAAILWTSDDAEAGAHQLYEMKKRMLGPKAVYCNWDERVWLLIQYFTAKSIVNYSVISINQYTEYMQKYGVFTIVKKSPSRRKLLVEMKNCKNNAYSLVFPLAMNR